MYKAYVKDLKQNKLQPEKQQSKMASKTAASKLKLVIFMGSTREGRLGERVMKFVCNHLTSKNQYEIEMFDPAVIEFPMLTKPLHFYKDKSEAPKHIFECNEKIKAADAFLFISCEYNHCIPPALSNMIDHFPGSSFNWRPSGIICYSPGIYGGMRAAMQLRAMTGEIGCNSVSNIFGIPKVHEAIDANGKPLDDHMAKGLDKLMTQLDWTAKAFRNMKDEHGVPT